MAAPDVIVVGAGIIGCAIAHECARRGTNVRVIEARTVAGGATQASAGVLAPFIEGHGHPLLRELGARSLDLYDAFVAKASEDSGLPVEYRRCGTLEVAPDDAAAERLRQRDQPAGAAQWLDGPAARALEPALSASTRGALLIPTHGYVAAGALTDALAWGAVRHGAQLETGHRVAATRSDPSGATVVAEDGTTWSAGEVILCTGSWLADVQLNIRAPSRAAITPIRGQLLKMTWKGTPLSRVIWGPNCYVVPWEDGHVLVGATVEDVGFDERTTAAGVRDLLDAVCELLPEAWGATFVEARAGLRPATADGLPVIGRSPDLPHVAYATGHYRNGVLLAPLTAQLIADAVLESRVDPLLSQLAP